MKLVLLFLFLFSVSSGAYDILISNCGVPQGANSLNGVLLNECSSKSSDSDSSQSSRPRLSPSLLLFLGLFVFDKKFLLLLCVVFCFSAASASISSLSPSDIHVDSSEKYFPTKYEASVTSNGILAAPEFYWYYDSHESYEYIVFEERGHRFMILKEFDSTQTHYVYSFDSDVFELFPTNRKIESFIGETYVLNLDEYQRGKTCYDVRRKDTTQFSYCLDGDKLGSLYEGYDMFNIHSFQFVEDGGLYSEIASRILAAPANKSIKGCELAQNSDVCDCCRGIATALENMVFGPECFSLSLSFSASTICGALVLALDEDIPSSLVCAPYCTL